MKGSPGNIDALEIALLADHPDLIPVLARWHWNEWGHADPGGSAEAWAEGLRLRSGREGIPITWVGFLSGKPVGSVALTADDMSDRPELRPWLSGLFVVAELRWRGIGTALSLHLERQAVRLGVVEVYLHTSTAEAFYARLGYRVLERAFYEGENVAVMAKTLVTSSSSSASAILDSP